MLLPDNILYVQHHCEADKNDQHQHDTAPQEGFLDFFRGLAGSEQLCQPHQRRIDQQREQNYARGGQAAEFREGTAHHRPPVKYKAQKAPQAQHQKSFSSHCFHGGQPRNKLDNAQDDGNHCADHTGRHRFFVVFRFRNLIRRRGGISEAHHRPERGQIHKPVQGVPAEQRQQDGKQHDKQNAVGGLGKLL